MNVTELARKLKVTSNELLDKLPELGFDIGKRAIKVDDRLALKIMDAWKTNERRIYERSRLTQIRGAGQTEAEAQSLQQAEIKIPALITVREYAAKLNLPISRVLATLMKNGVLASMNERIDFDTAMIIGEELGFKVIEDKEGEQGQQELAAQQKLKEILERKSGACKERPPVIVVMGHVDHGKTKILDAIRKTDVVSGESGGITQHIGAYQVHKNGRIITFIDTPGHEAFTAMRSRGARVADIAILVVAADDGVQPQTKEAIKIIQDAKIPYVVAINKIDKPEADIEKAKQGLSALGLLPEDWGGDVVCVPVSAKAGTGIQELLDTILLVADINKENIMADCERPAIGTIIESHVDKGEGPVATLLLQAGILGLGENLCVGEDFYGKVRALKDYQAEAVSVALPGMPVKILGLKLAPEVGSIMEVCSDIKNFNRDLKQKQIHQQKDFSLKIIHSEEQTDKLKFINLIIKADVLGSLEAIIESLAKLETPEVKIKIIGQGLGIITEADIQRAETSQAQIIGFHVKPATTVANLARDKKVEIKYYEVIYHLIEAIQDKIKKLALKEEGKKLLGQAEVIKIFRSEPSSMIIGAKIIAGDIRLTDTVVIIRKGEPISSGKVTRLECFKKQVEHVAEGGECGISYEGKPVVQSGDVLEFYEDK